MRVSLIAAAALLGFMYGCDDAPRATLDADQGRPDRGLADAAPTDRGLPDRGPADRGVEADGAATDAELSDFEAPDFEVRDFEVPDAAPPFAGPAPLLTEFMASNDTGLRDDDGRASDWIELYNPHPRAIDLGGFGLSDDADGAEPWILPDMLLAAGAYLVIFASGEDRRDPAAPLHADFRIDADGEPLTLVAPDGRVIQRFAAVPHAPDVAYGLPAAALIAAGAEARYRDPAPDDGWQAPDHPDDGWSSGPTGIGRDPGGPPSALDPWADALASHWTFDRTAIADGATMALDERIGSPRHLRLEGGARLTDGREGMGLTGGLARVLAAEGFDFSADFSWSLWMRGRAGTGALICRSAPGLPWSRGAKALFVRRGALRFDAGWVGAPNPRTFVNDDRWRHVAVTFRAADDRLRIYIDGAPRFDEVFDVDAFPEDLDDPPVRSGLFVGGTDFAGGLADLGPYTGRIDDVSIWSATLPAEAVGLLRDGEPPPALGPFAGLIATPSDADGVQMRLRFTVGAGLAAAVLRLRFDDWAAAWLDGDPLAAALGGARDDALAVAPLDVGIPLPAPGEHVLAVEAGADAEDPERWVALPELWALETAPAALVRATPGALNAPGRSPAVVIDPPEGVVVEPLEVRITAPGEPGGRPVAIHYTLDGRAPTAADPVYDGPLRLDDAATVRAVAIAEGRAPGPVASARFMALDPALGGFTSTVPVVIVDRGGEGPPPREGFGDALLAAWMPGEDGLTRLSDPPALVSRAALRIRGQSSAGFAKAPYRLELRDGEGRDRSEPLLGLPADADWVLHGPFVDKSLVRNALVYGLGRDMGLAAPRSTPFELYLRGDDGRVAPGDARGVYVLVERIEVHPDRLDLERMGPEDAAEPEITGGWILKFEAGAAEAPVVPGWQSLEVVEPGDPTAAQMQWVQAAIRAFDDALDDADFRAPDAAWRSMLDVESVMDHIIVNELFRDQDGYVRSQYLHKDREGPWVMGPLWDYNLTAGTGGFFDNLSTTGWQYRQQYNSGEHGWFTRMMDDPAFAAAVAARWRALRGGILADAAIAERVAGLTAALVEPAARNFAVWPNLGNGRISAFTSPVTATWEEQIEVLLDWLVRRSAWLDTQWAQ